MTEGGMAPGWYPDPAGKYELRWHDGSAWTDQVSERGATATDPFFDAEGFAAPMTSPSATTVRRGRGAIVAAAVVALAVVAAAVALLLAGGEDGGEEVSATESEEETTTSSTATTTTTTAPTTTTTEPVEPADVVGASIASALDQLRDAGFEVAEREVIDESVPDGEVVAAEEQPDGSVVLTVARAPVTRFLETVAPIEETSIGVGSPPFNVSGTTYSHGSTYSISFCRETGFVEYDLGRDYRRLQGTIGLTDDSRSGVPMRLEISVDGVIVSTQDFLLGDTAAVDLDVTGALRVRLQISRLDDSQCAFFGFGDGRLLGVPSEVPPEG